MKRKTVEMKQKHNYETPAVLRVVGFAPRTSLLAGSIVDKANVTSVGQKVDTYDFSDESFNHNWED